MHITIYKTKKDMRYFHKRLVTHTYNLFIKLFTSNNTFKGLLILFIIIYLYVSIIKLIFLQYH